MSTPNKFNRYEILREVGRGGMATLYLAIDPNFNRQVAVKVLPSQFTHDPQFRARFRREAQAIAKLEHPAIVPVYDFGEENGQPFLVMRFMEGGTLADVIEATGTISLEETVRILNQIAPGLDRAHKAGVVHRDIKPANTLFDDGNNAYISDFGIAKLAEATAQFTGNSIIGTPAYMSPEQVRGDGSLDGRSDVYSLGIMVYEMITGQLPYTADTPTKQLMKHVLDPIPRITHVKGDVSDAVEAVLIRALAKNPAERYSTAPEFAAALSIAVEQGGMGAAAGGDTIVDNIVFDTEKKTAAPPPPPQRTSTPTPPPAQTRPTPGGSQATIFDDADLQTGPIAQPQFDTSSRPAPTGQPAFQASFEQPAAPQRQQPQPTGGRTTGTQGQGGSGGPPWGLIIGGVGGFAALLLIGFFVFNSGLLGGDETAASPTAPAEVIADAPTDEPTEEPTEEPTPENTATPTITSTPQPIPLPLGGVGEGGEITLAAVEAALAESFLGDFEIEPSGSSMILYVLTTELTSNRPNAGADVTFGTGDFVLIGSGWQVEALQVVGDPVAPGGSAIYEIVFEIPRQASGTGIFRFVGRPAGATAEIPVPFTQDAAQAAAGQPTPGPTEIPRFTVYGEGVSGNISYAVQSSRLTNYFEDEIYTWAPQSGNTLYIVNLDIADTGALSESGAILTPDMFSLTGGYLPEGESLVATYVSPAVLDQGGNVNAEVVFELPTGSEGTVQLQVKGFQTEDLSTVTLPLTTSDAEVLLAEPTATWTPEPVVVEPTVDTTNRVQITGINTTSDGVYQVAFFTSNYTAQMPGEHIHFYFNFVSEDQAGVPGGGPWQIYPAASGAAASSPFTLFNTSGRGSATAICAVVANPDHTIQPGSGNCFPIP